MRATIHHIINAILLLAGLLVAIFCQSYFPLEGGAFLGIRFLTLFSLILLLLIVLVEIISLFFDKTASLNTVIIAIALLAYGFFSKDGALMLRLTAYPLVFRIIHSAAFYVTLTFFLRFFVRDFRTILPPFFLLICYAANGLLFALDVGLSFVGADFVVSLLALAFAILIYVIIFASIKGKKLNVFYFSGGIYALLLGSHIAEGFSFSFLMDHFPQGIVSSYLILIVHSFFAIYIDYAIRTSRQAYKNKAYEQTIEKLRSMILYEQINPHFIFNSLALIKTIYQRDPASGDRAVDLLSRHLRANIEVKGGQLLIPLEEELSNIQCYVELANMQNSIPLNILYNIDIFDFAVPILSIEPFVENAIRHSKIQSKEDGYIEIATSEDEGNYLLSIVDNGVGFDPRQIKEDHHGIANAAERFRALLQAEVEIISAIGEGTKIKIKIPKKGTES